MTLPELEAHVAPHGAIGRFLTERVRSYSPGHRGWSKILWDIANVAYLVNPAWMPLQKLRSLQLTEGLTWDREGPDRPVWEAMDLWRDRILDDFYEKLARAATPAD